jgi:hypothetical protein
MMEPGGSYFKDPVTTRTLTLPVSHRDGYPYCCGPSDVKGLTGRERPRD